MAELNNAAPNGAATSKKIRSQKLTSKVDLTAMVDLAFLLITFFMLTTSLSKPKSMRLTMPDQNGDPTKIDENRTLTLLVGRDEVKYYMGKQLADAKIVTPGKQLRREIAIRKKQVQDYANAANRPDGLIVLIKPDSDSNFGNVVDALDEMAISEVATYAIADITASERAVLRK